MGLTKFRPQFVTGIGADGLRVPGLRVESPQEVRDFLLPGPRVTDGQVVPSGWVDLECEECGDHAWHCPNLSTALPVAFVLERLAAERDELDVEVGVGWRHAEGLVVLTGTI